MPAALPDWLEHYRDVPSWVLFSSIAGDQVLWVNDRLASDLEQPRDWFVGRAPGDIWSDSHDRRSGRQAIAEGRSIDVIGDGKDLKGRWRWLDARFTPIDQEHLLIVCQDITARVKLSGLRLVLGQSFTGEVEGELSEAFARQLLEGASLEDLCKAESVNPVEMLGRLGKLLGEQQVARNELGAAVPLAEPPARSERVPKWVAHYWELPGPAILLEYPSLTVLWVNREILERNRLRAEEVVGVDADSIWRDVSSWRDLIDRTIQNGRPIDTVHQGHNLTGKQQWLSVHATPLGRDRVLLLSDDITADVRLQALRLLLGLNPEAAVEDRPSPSEAFARLLLDGASVANIAAALEMTAEEVRGQAALILGRSA